MIAIYWQGQHISCKGTCEYNKIITGDGASNMACDVSVQSRGLSTDTHGYYKYRELKRRIILIIKPNHLIRVFLKNRCLLKMQQIPNKTWKMVCTFKKMNTIAESYEAS